MQLKEKLASVKKSGWFKYLLIFVLLVVAVLILVSAVRNCMRYAPVKGKGVEVTAVASKIIETLDSDNMEEYQVYVDYEYQGKSYTVCYKTFRTYSKAKAVDTVTITINPDNPGEKMETLKSNMITGIIFGMVFLATAAAATGIRLCRDEIVAHGVSRENIRTELMNQIRHRRGSIWLLIVGIGFISFWIGFRNALSPLLAAGGLLILILGLKRLVADVLDWKKVKAGQFHLRQDPFVKKYVDSDSDSTTYRLVYGCDEDYWEIAVDEAEYSHTDASSNAISLFLEGEKKAVSRYRQTGSGWCHCVFFNAHRNGH